MAKMVSMAEALLQGGVISPKDIATLEERAEAECKAKLQNPDLGDRIARRNVKDSLPHDIVVELNAWEEESGIIVPLEILERWAVCYERFDRTGLLREWAKWLHAYSEKASA